MVFLYRLRVGKGGGGYLRKRLRQVIEQKMAQQRWRKNVEAHVKMKFLVCKKSYRQVKGGWYPMFKMNQK